MSLGPWFNTSISCSLVVSFVKYALKVAICSGLGLGGTVLVSICLYKIWIWSLSVVWNIV